MNFLRTMSLQRIADLLKIKLNGETMKTQSNLDIVAGRNMTMTQVETKDLTTLTVTAGGADGAWGWWGTFYDTTTQGITSTTTAYVIGINSSDPDNDGVTVTDGSKIVPTTPANYNISLSVQVTNDDTQNHEAVFWFRKNGTDVPYSASTVTVPTKHGGVKGHLIFYVDLALHFNAGDYLQLVWSATNTQVTVETLPAGTSPVYPVSPSVIVTVVQV
jgi:hypothetical protein